MRKKVLILGHNDGSVFIDTNNQYVRLFDPDQFEVTVAYLTGAPSEATRKRTVSEHVIFFNFPRRVIKSLKIRAVFELKKLCQRENFDIVICHRYKPTYIMMLVAQWVRIKALIFVMHELDTIDSWGRKSFIAAFWRKNMLFAGVSNAVRDNIRSHIWRVPKSQVITLYNMIDVNDTLPHILPRELARTRLNLDPRSFVFANVARLVRNKDQATLIKAFSELKAKYEHVKLLLIGEGDLQANLQALAQAEGLAQDVIFVGFLPQAFQYMKAFDCFVLSSKQEAFGRVLLEAMLAEVSVIATRVHGIPEVLRHTNQMVSAGNVAELSQAMQKIYQTTHEEREQSNQKAYDYVVDNFSIPKFKEQFWQLSVVRAVLE